MCECALTRTLHAHAHTWICNACTCSHTHNTRLHTYTVAHVHIACDLPSMGHTRVRRTHPFKRSVWTYGVRVRIHPYMHTRLRVCVWRACRGLYMCTCTCLCAQRIQVGTFVQLYASVSVYIHAWHVCRAHVSMMRLFICICARVLDVRTGAHQSRCNCVYRHACGMRENGLVHVQLSIHVMHLLERAACV